MNTATKKLEDDHVHILRLIGVMQRITGSEAPDVSHLESIADIIRNYADGLHHAREEKIFFPFLATRGFSLTQGPVGVMINEHVRGREFAGGMAENIAAYKAGRKDALERIYSNMNGYSELLQNHISKENHILFRMADNAMSENDQQLLASQFDEAEKNRPRGSTSEDYIARIEKLAAAYGV